MIARRIGAVLGLLCGAFLLMDASLKIFRAAPAVTGTVQLGYAGSLVAPIGVLLLVSTLLAIVPRTRMLGALLLTAYLGGATASLVRSGQAWFFPVILGALGWASLWLRDERVRALFSYPARAADRGVVRSLTVAAHKGVAGA